ncbi:unnamed protein product [Cunninghamella echinulata]
MTKLNSQTTHLCKHLNLDSMDNSLIDFQIVGTVINAFQDNLQCNLTAKTKLANDILEALLKPLQDLLKVDIKEFKDMRKTYEKVLDKYENYLCRYSVLSKQKEPSALREDTFQLFDVQKSYIHTSGDYFLLLITLKSKIEHTLVDCFSCGVVDHMDALNTSMQSSNSVKTMISGWRQWLDESQKSSKYQLDQIKKSSHILEDALLKQIKPHRSLKRYSTTKNDLMVAISHSSTSDSLLDDQNNSTNDNTLNNSNDPKMESNTSLVSASSQDETVNNFTGGENDNDEYFSSSKVNEKHGYLFSRIIVGKPNRYSWVRRWFFLKDGWLGQYNISTVNKIKGCLVIGDRIQVSTCESKIYTDTDRRFCFEIKGEKCSFILQAESEKDMQKWLWAIEKAKENELNHANSETSTLNTPHTLLSPFANEIIHKQLENSSQVLLSLFSSPPTLNTSSNFNSTSLTEKYLNPNTSTIASITKLLLEEDMKERKLIMNEKSNNNNAIDNENDNEDNESIASIPPPPPDKTSNNDSASNHSNQESPLPRRLISSSSTTTASTTSSSNSPWSVPWLISGITSLSSNADQPIETNGWILKSNNNNEPDTHIIWPNKIELDTADVTLENYSDDLQSKNHELRKYFSNVSQDEIVYNVFAASIHNRQSDQPNSKIELGTNNIKEKSYSGTVYVTQKNIWFYSCQLITFVNATVIPLKNIKSIRLEKVLSTNSQGMLMNIDTVTEPTFTFGLWLDAAELIGEKLRILIEYAKGSLELDEQTLFDTINNLSVKKTKTPTLHLTANTTPNISVTPLTVQAQSKISLERQQSLESLSDNDNSSSSLSASSSTSENGINNEILENNHPISCSPAAGALTAAMEAANEALHKSKLQKNTKKSTSPSSTTNTPNRTVTPPPPPIPSNSVTRKKSLSSSSTAASSKNKNRHISTSKPLPKYPVDCECQDHLEKEEANVELAISAKGLYQYMFGNEKDHTFWEKLHQEKGNSDLNIAKWVQNGDGKKERTLTYLMPVNNPMVKVKEAEVTEVQEIQKEINESCYVIIITTKTPMLPYADAFIPTIKLCITYNTSSSCNLRCSTGVKWLKSIMVKGMVNRAAFKGMAETISVLLKIVEVAAETQKNVPGNDQQQQNNNVMTKKRKSIKGKDSSHSTSDQMLEKENHGSTYQKWKNKIVQHHISDTLLSPIRLLGYCLLGLALLLAVFVFYSNNNSNFVSFLPTFITRNNQTITTYNTNYQHPTIDKSISWRAVYISDLDTILYGNDFKLENKSNSRAYELFKKSRKDIAGWKYRWFNVKHKLMASEMTYTREQIAVLRYELLTAFKLLNGMEQRLLQSEYWNWLLDQKLRCGCNHEQNQQFHLCIDVNNELEQLE